MTNELNTQGLFVVSPTCDTGGKNTPSASNRAKQRGTMFSPEASVKLNTLLKVDVISFCKHCYANDIDPFLGP